MSFKVWQVVPDLGWQDHIKIGQSHKYTKLRKIIWERLTTINVDVRWVCGIKIEIYTSKFSHQQPYSYPKMGFLLFHDMVYSLLLVVILSWYSLWRIPVQEVWLIDLSSCLNCVCWLTYHTCAIYIYMHSKSFSIRISLVHLIHTCIHFK